MFVWVHCFLGPQVGLNKCRHRVHSLCFMFAKCQAVVAGQCPVTSGRQKSSPCGSDNAQRIPAFGKHREINFAQQKVRSRQPCRMTIALKFIHENINLKHAKHMYRLKKKKCSQADDLALATAAVAWSWSFAKKAVLDLMALSAG
eukprot:scpid51428/ scgid28026/ 